MIVDSIVSRSSARESITPFILDVKVLFNILNSFLSHYL
nr:MAG TPA: hypothetical protein [Crassvirales sp.]